MNTKNWLRLAFALLALLFAASWGLSLALGAGWARRPLLARLAASFGRPVEVRRFGFSLLSGPRLEADAVTVAEDPRFGQEYFLRADQLSASLRWTALLHGRIEFSGLSLDRPSLNVVRALDGSWNIESWLPPAGTAAAPRAAGAPASAGSRAPLRYARVEIDDGRINFKRGVDKLPFALVDLSGSLDQDGAGRWSIDLSARPMRVPVALQEAGMLRLRGSVAGTSARLRPAAIELDWEDASLADAVRLAYGGDYGLRGTLAAEFSASTANPPAPNPSSAAAGSAWSISGVIRVAGVHRYDLIGRDFDPALNVRVTASWRNGEPRVEVKRLVVEAPQSHLDAEGEIAWAHGFEPSARIAASSVSLEDLLAWRRALSANVADDLSLDGAISVSADLAGWPPGIQNAEASSTAVTIRADALPGPIRILPAAATLDRGVFAVAPVMVNLPNAAAPASPRSGIDNRVAPAGALRIEAALGPFRPGEWPRDWPCQWTVAGQTSRAQDLTAVLAAFGVSHGTDWTADGPARLDLTWAGSLRKGTAGASGSLDFAGLRLASVALNQPVVISSAHVELRPGERHVRISSAQAFGARWSGSLDWQAGGGWNFDLAADRLDADELDRWLGPRARPGLLERLLPFAGSADPPSRDAALARLRGSGRLRVAEVSLAPLRLQKLDASAEISGRNIALHRAQASLYGGKAAGEFEALLSADPAYAFHGEIERANLAALANATASLAGRFSGLASGRITLTARGIGRSALLASLAGEGRLEIRDAVVAGLPPIPPDAGGPIAIGPPGEEQFGIASAAFRIQGARVRMDRLLLVGHDEQYEVAGTVGFARDLDLRIQRMLRPSDADPAAKPVTEAALGPVVESEPAAGPPPGIADAPGDDVWVVRGTMEAPRVSRSSGDTGNPGSVPAARR